MAVVKSNDILGTGRRKTSVARVRIRPGEGKIRINNRDFEQYFNNTRQRNAVLAALEQTGRRAQLDVIIRVDGGGIPARPTPASWASPGAEKVRRSTFRRPARFRPANARRSDEGAEKYASRRPQRHPILETVVGENNKAASRILTALFAGAEELAATAASVCDVQFP